MLSSIVAAGGAFASKAKEHKASADRRLKGIWALVVIIAGAALFSMFYPRGPQLARDGWWLAANISHFGARILFVSILSYALVTAVRSYRAERHNQVSNEHRRNALSTYEHFNEGASDRTKDAVALQAMEAVFGPQPTGYSGKEPASATRVAELLRVLKGDADVPTLKLGGS